MQHDVYLECSLNGRAYYQAYRGLCKMRIEYAKWQIESWDETYDHRSINYETMQRMILFWTNVQQYWEKKLKESFTQRKGGKIMKVSKKQVMQTVNVYIADDGREFANARDCKDYEYDQAVNDAKIRFDFKFTDSYKDEFTLVYREGHVNELALDLSYIINYRWDVDSTNMAGEYDYDTIMSSLERDLCEKFIDGHTYKFSGYLSYVDEDHPDDFCMDIDDITEDEIKKLDPPKQKDKAEDIISTFIVNQLGINLVAVKDIHVDRQSDGQIKQIKIDFIPDNKV